MMTKYNNLQQTLDVMKQANEIAASIDVQMLVDKMLGLLITITQARTAACYLYNEAQDTLHCQSSRDIDDQYQDPGGTDANHPPTPTSLEISHMHSIMVQGNLVCVHPSAEESATPTAQYTVCYLPMLIDDRPLGIIRLCGLPSLPSMSSTMTDATAPGLDSARQVVERLAPDIEKARLIDAQKHLLQAAEYREKRAEYHESRLESLIDFISKITTTLERKELIRLIMSYAEKLLDVEATSFWLLDEHDGRLKLLVAAGDLSEAMNEVSVGMGEGIIGHVVQTGQRKVVNDVRQEPMFNINVDRQSGFVTRSILSVPMRAPRIYRGDLRGEIKETVIGGAQALNKRDGSPFTEEDIRCFETLARQAATAFQFSNLFEEDFTLFWGVVKAATSAIDLIDPYTSGHSARVSDFSVAIAEQLELPAEAIYRVRVGSMLHDVGKIGVDVQVLKKPGRLTDDEFQEMQRHPMYGVKLFNEAGLSELLAEELMALAQHHERLDGRGYPSGLSGEEISRIGRIVAVADTFDALTSDRPYRSALSAEEAFAILDAGAGTELDSACVAALKQARIIGKIRTQHEREE